MPRLPLLVVLCLCAPPAVAADKRPMQIEDLFKFKRVAEPQVSPDGKLVVYQVGSVNLADNKTTTDLWIAGTDGKTPLRQLTNAGKSDKHPRWSPDGKQILFESNRSGSNQIWVIDLNGGEARKLTDISTEASNAIWSPDSSHIAFVSAVYPEFSEKPFKESNELNKKKIDEVEKNPVKAKVFSRLFYRHWVEYVSDKRQHLFVMKMPAGPNGSEEPRDVTPGDRDAYPTSTTFSVGDDFVFSPDGKYLVFTAVPEKNEAWSTNHDICRVPIDNTSTKWEALTKDNPAADASPRFSPEGTKLAYRAQKKAGYEADKWDIYVVDCDGDGAFKGEPRSLTGHWDRSIDEFAWAMIPLRNSPESGLLAAADANGLRPFFRVALNGASYTPYGDKGGACGSLSVSKDGRQFAFTIAQIASPAEVYTGSYSETKSNPPLNVSRANDALLSQLDLPRPESVEVNVEDGKMQMWILKPPGFDPSKKWPVVYLVHGGPQGAWENGWSYRWNPELWAAQGYIVALPNPRGSTGFGQKFVDEISGDWGGKCYRDLMAGVDYLEKLPYVDKDRIAAAGASFGGYMMDWFAVSTGRFKTLITHCSVWNFESMWGTTDELWFDEYEHGGLPWEVPGKYAEFSPHKKAANLGKFKTPMLIIHNDLDFRCPIGQGHELFSALQRQGVPSKFINFPDEGHWVLKPKNSEFWHREVFAWLKKYVPPGGK
jgi:dipeptidyl aminopeptidase/acylaminoacyl peptidase